MYGRAARFDFVFDDHSLIGPDGPRWLGPEWIPYRPLRYLSLWLDHAIGGGSPAVYHATNIALHAAAAALVVLAARRFGARRGLAAAAGVLFAAHPLAIEAVAYVAGRRDLLALVFGLGALLAWTADRPRTRLALFLAIGSVAAKESGAVTILVLAAASRAGLGPRLDRGRLASLATAAVAAGLLAIAYGATGPLWPGGTLGGTVSMALHLSAHYGRHLLWPAGLSVEYPALAGAALSWPGPIETITGAASLLVASWSLAWALWRPRRGALALALFWPAAVFLSVALVIGAHEPGADRHAYPLLASMAVSIAVAASTALNARPLKARGAGVLQPAA
ncbi:MAG: hypothetical protein D6760_04490, partial [Deltaproteobacteria bacterium]